MKHLLFISILLVPITMSAGIEKTKVQENVTDANCCAILQAELAKIQQKLEDCAADANCNTTQANRQAIENLMELAELNISKGSETSAAAAAASK